MRVKYDMLQQWLQQFENGRIIDRGNYRTRKTLESWHTMNTKDADNNSKPLPEPYLILLN